MSATGLREALETYADDMIRDGEERTDCATDREAAILVNVGAAVNAILKRHPHQESDTPLAANIMGPRRVVKLVCDGCPMLKTERWTDHLDNYETDCGTKATCGAACRTIDVYYHEGQNAPKWCPIIQGDPADCDADAGFANPRRP